MTNTKDCKRIKELIALVVEREIGHCSRIMPLPDKFSLLDGYEEHTDADIAMLTYHIAGDKSAHSVACRISDGLDIDAPKTNTCYVCKNPVKEDNIYLMDTYHGDDQVFCPRCAQEFYD